MPAENGPESSRENGAESGADGTSRDRPVRTVARGAAAGLAAAVLLSALSRVVPGVWNEDVNRQSRAKPGVPEDPFDAEQVQAWQQRSQSPAACGGVPGGAAKTPAGPPAAQPAGALTQPQGPGPEGLAEQFAFKVASGVFGRDISKHIRAVGMTTHLSYGSSWGVVYGLFQTSCRAKPGPAGAIFGALVYGVGPALLVPAMKIMGRPRDEPPARTCTLLAGHIIYGVSVAAAFGALERRDA